jgi:exopolysaccharide biosynthesis polyprenyl glycosylphosphotransferase
MAVALAFVEAVCIFLALWILRVRPPAEALIFTVACATAFYYCELYDFRVARTLRDCAPRFLRALGLVLLAVAVLDILVGVETRDGTALVTALLMATTILLAGRACYYGVLRRRPYTKTVVMLGGGRLAAAVLREVAARPHLRWAVGVVTEAPLSSERRLFRFPVLGGLADFASILDRVRPRRIVVALAETERMALMPALLEARGRGIRVEDAVDVYERITGKLAIEMLPAANLVFGKGFRLARGHAAVGRATSLAVAAIGLVLLAPLMALIALAVKVESGGPVFFRQERIGRHGKRFWLIKFRTMRPVSAEPSAWVRDNADRITSVGQFLRKFRLDELPQFLNVVRGDMNFVGPRPHPVVNYELFTREIPYYALRSAVRPGLTGWAQVRYGYANNLEEETEKMRYDLYYVKHLSWWLDLRILIDTVGVVVSGRGSVDSSADDALALPRESRPATTEDAA